MRNKTFLISMFLVIVAIIVGTSTTFADTWSKEVVDLKSNVLKSYSRGIEVDAHGNTHIVYGHNNLSHAFFVRGKWKYEVVDASPGVGQYASLAMDKDGQMHISYYDAINKNLKYAKGNFGSWSVETIGSNGRDEGKYTSLTVDASGYVHISYVSYDGRGRGHLNYATNKSGAWVTEKVAENVDYETSIAIDAGGKAHISYCETIPHTVCSLIYTRKESNVWNGERLESGNGELLVGRNSSLVVDTTGKTHITYESSSLNQQGTTVNAVKYISNTMGQWSPKVVFAGDNKGGISQYVYASLAVDKLGNAHIVSNETSSKVFSSGTRYYTKVKYATVDSKGAIVEQTVDEINGAQRSSYGIPSLAIAKSGETYVSYVENNKLLLTKAPATITVKSPNGGESWTAGDRQSITWTYEGNPGVNVGINLLKGGSFASTIISSTPLTSGLYDWKIPVSTLPDTDYKVTVFSTANPGIAGTSTNNFEIVAATGTITVTNPIAADDWTAGTKQDIKWTYTGNPGTNVKINLLKGGTLEGTIISSTPIANGAYNWKIPTNQAPGADYQVKLISTANSAIKNSSDEFEIVAATGTITVSSPLGGENWTAGTKQDINWAYTGNPGTEVKINLLKGGSYLSTIISNTPIGSGGNGTYNWKIPTNQVLGSDYAVKLISTANSAIGTTTNNFQINPATGTITVSSPLGGENWTAGTKQDIKWAYSGNPGTDVKINLLKGGNYLSTIISNTPIGSGGSGTYNWKIPTNQVLGSDYAVKLVSTANSAIGTTTNNFQISPATGTITVSSPLGGENWTAGTQHDINWAYSGNPGTDVKINLLKGGSYSSTIVSSTPIANGTYSWKIPTNQVLGIDFAVKLISTANSAIGTTTNNFRISEPVGDIKDVTPSGGTLTAGTAQPISWTYTGNPGTSVKIELLKADAFARTITDTTPIGSSGSGTYNWNIPLDVTPSVLDYKVRVTSTSSGTSTGKSAAPFTILEPVGTIAVTSPDSSVNGAGAWKAAETHAITWTYSGNFGSAVKIELYKADVYNRTITNSTPIGNNSFSWKIPDNVVPGTDYRVKLTSTTATTKTGISVEFTIDPPAGTITVVTPNGGEKWAAATMQKIEWNYTLNPGSNVSIKLLKGGSFNRSIVTQTSIGSAGSGSYNWTIPSNQTPGTDYTVQVTSTANLGITGTSSAFEIKLAGTAPQ